jgi:exopolysaccharide biosynthesis polyprenyl glycosylphosphotransferase
MEVVGLVSPDSTSRAKVNGLPIVGELGELGRLIRRYGIEELILIPTALERDKLLDIYRDWGTSNQVEISFSSGLYELFTTGARVKEVGFIPFVNLNRTRITGVVALAKMAVDYIGALFGTIFLAPLFLLIAVLIRLDSKGPVVYRRRVVGLHGRVFDAFKFRTMVVNAEKVLESDPDLKKEWEECGKIECDPRITRVGRFLRRTSLDELPQLFNVLRVEMSLVGPRMITPAERRHFGRWQHNRQIVKPGMTGLWQVSGRSDLPYEDRVRLDMQYIRNHTIWLDLRILFNTVTVVLKRRGAC